MDFHLTKEQLLVRKMYRDFAENEVKPLAAEIDEEERFPMETVEKMAKLGMMGIYFPKQYGGAGADVLSYAMCVEELAKVCGTTAVIVSAHTSLCAAPIFENGTEEQKMKYLPDLCSGKKIGAFGLTEPGAGTDAQGQQTTAGLDESGAVLEAEQLRPYYQQPRVLGLAELMNSYGTVRADEKILQKIRDCTAAGKKIDGHAPFLSGEELNAYVAAGVQSDHECSDIHEAMEKLRRGQYIMVREGTAAQNMDSLLPLFREPYCSRCMLVTDDKHPGDLLQGGHIDYIIRKAIAAGVDPVVAVRMGTLVPCQYFGLAHSGAVAPGYTADLIVLSDLEKFTVEQVYKKGKLVAQQGKMLHPAALAVDKARFARVFDSFNMDEITPEQLQLKQTGTRQRVICLTPHSLLTTEKIVPFCQHPGTAPGVDVTQQIVKLAVFERHHRSGHVGLGFLGNYGLQCGAVASSIAHDSHNLIVAGTNDADMVLAGNTVRKNKGGLAFALNGQVVGELPLPVAGLMSTESAEAVEEKLQALKAALKAHGISEDIDAFMTLAFVSLPVIPKLRLNTYGIVDVDAQQIVPAVF